MNRNRVSEQMKQERRKLAQERERLLRQVDILTANIALIDKFCGDGDSQPPVPLIKLAPEVMKAMKRFTRRELAERVNQEHPGIQFSEHSLSKPLSVAIRRGDVQMVQPNVGSKKQAVYEWVKS